jgi:membrane protein YdbS with pleckstrin-like domain
MLNRRVKIRWFLERVPVAVPFIGAIYGILYLTTYSEPGGMGTADYAVFAIAAAAVLAAVYAYVEIRYRKFVFALRERDFLIQKGVIGKVRYVIPYEKIQNVTVSRDIIDQALGLGTLHIETAAHVIVDNDIVLPGVSNEENLVSELVERSREARDAAGEAPATMINVMKEILEELRAIRQAAEKGEAPDKPAPKGGSAEQMSGEIKKTKVLFDSGLPKRKGVRI